MNTVNQRVKDLRISLGMNQKKFGERIGIAQTYLSQIEKGDRDVTDKIFRIICLEDWGGKKVNPDWLEDGIGEMFIEKTKDEQIASLLKNVQDCEEVDFKKRLISALARLDSDGWKKLEELIDMISNKN